MDPISWALPASAMAASLLAGMFALAVRWRFVSRHPGLTQAHRRNGQNGVGSVSARWMVPGEEKLIALKISGFTFSPIRRESEPRPAVPIAESITHDFIISLETGRKFRSLKGHLAKLGMTPQDYRAKWGLPADYPMVAPAYEHHSDGAKIIGLGRNYSKIEGDAKRFRELLN